MRKFLTLVAAVVVAIATGGTASAQSPQQRIDQIQLDTARVMTQQIKDLQDEILKLRSYYGKTPSYPSTPSYPTYTPSYTPPTYASSYPSYSSPSSYGGDSWAQAFYHLDRIFARMEQRYAQPSYSQPYPVVVATVGDTTAKRATGDVSAMKVERQTGGVTAKATTPKVERKSTDLYAAGSAAYSAPTTVAPLYTADKK